MIKLLENAKTLALFRIPAQIYKWHVIEDLVTNELCISGFTNINSL